AVTANEPKVLTGLSQQATRRARGLKRSPSWATNAAGEMRGPNPSRRSIQRNTVSPSPPLRGTRAVRRADGAAGKRPRRKQTLGGNRRDRGGDITPRESGQTSAGSSLTREPGQPPQEAKQMTAAATQAGAASGDSPDWHAIDWRKVHAVVRRLQARIVKAV